jgi:hypothetical protein
MEKKSGGGKTLGSRGVYGLSEEAEGASNCVENAETKLAELDDKERSSSSIEESNLCSSSRSICSG